jgi:hypothetical protein
MNEEFEVGFTYIREIHMFKTAGQLATFWLDKNNTSDHA